MILRRKPKPGDYIVGGNTEYPFHVVWVNHSERILMAWQDNKWGDPTAGTFSFRDWHRMKPKKVRGE